MTTSDSTQKPTFPRLPLGFDDFGKVIREKLYFVDKSLLIKELLDDVAEVILLTRPRRFGKSLNLSMLHYFFALEVLGTPTKDLFEELYIVKAGDEYMRHQGKYPVIYLSLKGATGSSMGEVYQNLQMLFARTYGYHRIILDSPHVSTEDKTFFSKVLDGTAAPNISLLSNAFLHLSACLSQHYGEKVVILIDEYDAPIQSAYVHGFYEKMIDFIRNLFGNGLKSNPYLFRAVLTGITRVSKESIFSGLNNLKVYSVLNSKYAAYFGFTEEEVKALLAYSHLEGKIQDIRSWYNGYRIGQTTVYNPWSIVNYFHDECQILRPYWVNTSSNALINDIIRLATDRVKSDLELLLHHKTIVQSIDENFVFADLEQDGSVIWSLLLASGYLTATEASIDENYFRCTLRFPNHEVEILYQSLFKRWFSLPMGGEDAYADFLKDLIYGRFDIFTLKLRDYFEKSASLFDVSGKQPEKFYHGFVLGLIVGLQHTHEVQSNRESGYGLYDIMIIPKDHSQPGLILEFKTVHGNTVLAKAALDAIAQIDARNYAAQLVQLGIQTIFKLGLAFRGKEVEVAFVK